MICIISSTIIKLGVNVLILNISFNLLENKISYKKMLFCNFDSISQEVSSFLVISWLLSHCAHAHTHTHNTYHYKKYITMICALFKKFECG